MVGLVAVMEVLGIVADPVLVGVDGAKSAALGGLLATVSLP